MLLKSTKLLRPPSLPPGVAAERALEAPTWQSPSEQPLARLRDTLEASGRVLFDGAASRQTVTVAELAREYLNQRSDQLRPGGFKSVRYSVGLFASKFGDRDIDTVTRDDGRTFLSLLPQLSKTLGKSPATVGLSLDDAVAWSATDRRWIVPRTQRRIWSQVNHFLDWVVYQGHVAANPFKTVSFEAKVRRAPYAVPTDAEVRSLLRVVDTSIHHLLRLCLLTGMRSGEAAGMLRGDLVVKGNLGVFARVQPNELRELKTEGSEREVPVHADLLPILDTLPAEGPLFPNLSVNMVTKSFTSLKERLGVERQGLVFHSTRKWFITQCERTGVPEHFTASLVGHQSARSENRLTYSIYSAGISDEQKRRIIDQIRLPT